MMLDSKIWSPEQLQQSFRLLMDAFSYPGEVRVLEPVSDYCAAEQIVACLVDSEVSLYAEDGLLEDAFIRVLRTGIANTDQADFLLLSGEEFREDIEPNISTLECPEEGATVILKVKGFSKESESVYKISGPGVPGSILVGVEGLDSQWISARNEWCAHFPLGVDMILVSPDQVMAIPRSSTVIKEDK